MKSCANIGVCFDICKGFVINLVKPELVNEGGGVTVGVEVGGGREIVDRAFSTDANDVVGHFAYTVVVGGLGVFDGGSMLVDEVFGRYGVALVWVVLHFDTACAKGFELAGKEGGECLGVHFSYGLRGGGRTDSRTVGNGGSREGREEFLICQLFDGEGGLPVGGGGVFEGAIFVEGDEVVFDGCAVGVVGGGGVASFGPCDVGGLFVEGEVGFYLLALVGCEHRGGLGVNYSFFHS